jgi:hypothetical protein
MSTSHKSVRELRSGDVLTLEELSGTSPRRYGKVVRVQHPHRGSDGRYTVIVAVQYLLEPSSSLTVTELDWDAPPA